MYKYYTHTYFIIYALTSHTYNVYGIFFFHPESVDNSRALMRLCAWDLFEITPSVCYNTREFGAGERGHGRHGGVGIEDFVFLVLYRGEKYASIYRWVLARVMGKISRLDLPLS